MTTLLELSIPGDPVGKARARVARGGTHAYTPGKTKRWEGITSMMARSAWRHGQLDEPVAVHVRAVAARPLRLLGDDAPAERIWRIVKPDGDNVLKAVCDALKKAGIVVDDSRFARKTVDSLYAALGEEPCVEVVISLPGDYEP